MGNLGWPARLGVQELHRRRTIMRLHIEAFHHIPLFEFAGADWDRSQLTGLDDQIYTKALDVALDHGFGLIWTGFIDGVVGWDRELMNRYWKRVPIIAEDNRDYLEIKDQGTHGTLDENLDLMLEYHANLAHYYVRSATYARAMRGTGRISKGGCALAGWVIVWLPSRSNGSGNSPLVI